MGFFRRLFGAKKSGSSPSPAKEKRRWGFNRTSNSNPSQPIKREAASGTYDDTNLDSNKHAIAVAAATAAVAEAALAAAQAAAEVVRLTNGGGRSAASGNRRRWMEEIAAVKIQSAFRGYLARRALRALKALVKLQALVRGHIVRKQTADMLRRMQTLVRLQARARATRSHLAEPCRQAGKSSRSNHSRCGSVSNFRDIAHTDKPKPNQNWLEHWMEESFHSNSSNTPSRNRHEDERTDKILEVDTWRPHKKSQSITNITRTFTPFDSPSKTSSNLKNQYAPSGEDTFSPSSRPGSSGRRGNFTPTKSEASWGAFNGYVGHPNYMANTESFRAKLRSQSAPRQRPEFENYGTVVNRSVQEYCCDVDTVSERGYLQRVDSRNRTRSPCGRLSRVGSTNLR